MLEIYQGYITATNELALNEAAVGPRIIPLKFCKRIIWKEMWRISFIKITTVSTQFISLVVGNSTVIQPDIKTK